MENQIQCRSCSGLILKNPTLILKDVPLSAQGFSKNPDEAKSLAGNLILKECQCCGLIQLDTPPVDYYKSVIRSAAASAVLLNQKRQQFHDFIQEHNLNNKKLIEIGCGRGEFLSILNQFNLDSFGVEYSSVSVQKCCEEGLRVEQNYLSSSTKLQNAPFDAFVCLMFLEHMPAPRDALIGIASNLSEDAVGIIEVPSLDFLLRKNLLTEFIPDHLTYFTQSTLTTLLSISGFNVLTMHESRDDYVLTAIVRKRTSLKFTNDNPSEGRLSKDIHDFLKKMAGTNIAVWGAGHQALASLGMFHMESHVSMIIDSSPLKQGLFAPGCALPIYSPEALITNKIAAVIVMAGSYSDEIVEIIKTKYSFIQHIAVAKEDNLICLSTIHTP